MPFYLKKEKKCEILAQRNPRLNYLSIIELINIDDR